MTPSVAAASPAVAPVAPLALISTAARDSEWWAEEAVHAGTDWYGVVAAALEMMVAVGMMGQPAVETMTAWDIPSWRPAIEYHHDRPGRLVVEIEPKRLARLRRMMADDVSLERTWHELRDKRSNFQKSDFR